MDPLKTLKKERVASPLSEVSDHAHDGRGSKMLNTANFLAVTVGPPAWVGREGEIMFQADPSGPTYSMWVWLGGDWREFPYTP
jgi:hypothetical protein